jgi:hypothetical protein
VRVVAFDQVDLPRPVPALQLLLAGDRAVHVAEPFEVDEAEYLVAGGEAFDDAAPVLVQAGEKVGGDADVQRTVRLAGEDVDAGLPVHRTFHSTCGWRDGC